MKNKKPMSAVLKSVFALTLCVSIFTLVCSLALNYFVRGEITYINVILGLGIPAILTPIFYMAIYRYVLTEESFDSLVPRSESIRGDNKIGNDTYEYLSRLTPVFSILMVGVPYLLWVATAQLSDHGLDDPRYLIYGLFAIISFASALWSYHRTSLRVWLIVSVIIYTIVPFGSLLQAFNLNTISMFSLSCMLISLLYSFRVVLLYSTLSFGLITYIVYMIDHGYLYDIQVYGTKVVDGQVVDLNMILPIYGGIAAAYCASLVVSWITDMLVRSSADRRQELIVAYNHLEEKKTHQDHMFAIIGHELRTPISASVMLLDDVIHASKTRNISSKYFDTIVNTKQELDHTLSILDDMRIVSSKDTVKEYSNNPDYPAQTIRRVINTLERESHESGIKIISYFDELSSEQYIYPTRALMQIGLNIIKNVIRHSKADELLISMKSEIIEDDPEHCNITLEFTDNGIGIPKHLHEKIFDAFYSRDASNTANTGLGLFIVKELTEVMDGSVKIKSSIGSGTSFIFKFRMLKSDNAPVIHGLDTAIDSPETVSWSGKKVLLVEDNLTIQRMTQKILEKLGADVDIADDGTQGLYKFKTNIYDVVITDYFMPEMDGAEMAMEIRKFSNVPIIGVTAATVGEEFETLIKSGVNTVLSKPANAKTLLDALEEVLYD